MKYSLKQIKKYVPELAKIATKDLMAKIWTSIAEVESADDVGKKYEGVVVAKILTVEQHPKSEKLVIVTIDAGQKEPITVVTAAHNVQVGDFVPYIPDGGYVPVGADEQGNRFQIGIRSMAGIPSVGMLASEREMGVSDDHSGIMLLHPEELREELVVGEPVARALELDDVIFEIENKSLTHRGDCFSVSGIAREIAAMYNFPLQIPEWQQPSLSIPALVGDSFDKELPCELEIQLTALSSVERYSAIVLDGVQVAPSPLWLRVYMQKHGINAVNNVVDVTNYIMLEYGQPMHAFDSATIAHKRRENKIHHTIEVRNARAGESLVTLDGKERKLPAIATLITDSKDAVAIAGIIGGKASGITENSTRIILESAVFNKYAIRNASMSLGIKTDASVVFSRKQDPEKTVRALLRAVHLLGELTGATVSSPIADAYPKQAASSPIVVSHAKLEAFLGIAVSPVQVVQILEALGCSVLKKNGMYRIQAPTWRPDLGIDEDIYEEVARMVGYQEITPELPVRGIFGVSLSFYEQVRQKSLTAITALGLTQSMNFSFVSKELYNRTLISLKDARSIANAISPDVEYLRKHLIPQMTDQLARNQYNAQRFGMFELGKTSRKGLSYTGDTEMLQHMPSPTFGVDELGVPIEDEHLAFGVVDDSAQPAFYTLKQLIVRYLESLRISVEFVHPDDLGSKNMKLLPLWVQELLPHYKQGRVALILEQQSTEFMGILGEPTTLISKEFGFTKQTCTAEFTFHKIVRFANLVPHYVEPSKYPTITEDFCFEVPVAVSIKAITNTFRETLAGFQDKFVAVTSVRDIFQKKENAKQVTSRVVYSPVSEGFNDSVRVEFRKQLTEAMKKLGGALI